MEENAKLLELKNKYRKTLNLVDIFKWATIGFGVLTLVFLTIVLFTRGTPSIINIVLLCLFGVAMIATLVLWLLNKKSLKTIRAEGKEVDSHFAYKIEEYELKSIKNIRRI